MLVHEAGSAQIMEAIDRAGGLDRAIGGGEIAHLESDHIGVVLRRERGGEQRLAVLPLPGGDHPIRRGEAREAVLVSIAGLAKEGPKGSVDVQRPAGALQHHGAPVGLQR